MWSSLPEPLLLEIFKNLTTNEMANVCLVCHQWSRVGCDDLLWKHLFYKRFDTIDRSVDRPIGSFESETLEGHDNQVLHVSFAHNGRLFSSCSKDGFVKLWSTECVPTRVRHSADMKQYSWNYTQYSQFNEADTLLLVSGVHFGVHTASGEIAVFNLESDDFQLQCRVLNKPYDIFGTWYTNDYLISSRLHFLGHLVSCSALWLNKAWQESESERKPIIKRMFKFYNKNASSIRTVLVADCLPDEPPEDPLLTATASTSDHKPSASRSRNQSSYSSAHRGNPFSSLGTNRLLKSLQTPPNYSQRIDFYGADSNISCTNESPIRYSSEYRCEQRSSATDSVGQRTGDTLRRAVSNDTDSGDSDFDDPPLPWNEDWLKLSDDELNEDVVSDAFPISKITSKKHSYNKSSNSPKVGSHSQNSCTEEESSSRSSRLLCNRDKLLLFTSGSQTYTPHQIGIKRIKPIMFEEFVSETASLSKRLEERRQEQESQAMAASPNWHEEEAVAHMFDTVDHTIDLKGHIIGMGLSPDHRYLYVNSRSWPENATIDNPLHPPPIANQIDIHVIDLKTFKRVGNMFRSHKAYTPNDECFFIFLDVCDQFVASGAEDNHGYIWDRHYGLCLARLPHRDIVNSVAFNPKDPEMMVTASDDKTLKIWRSKSQMIRKRQP
ncbi:unnamed protein product [Medioppia subpectinata]|uniref:F-box domain-containing protein n=1 Tax=Medioppia subpectinata TaxID=1979941 RepID=A0A7R9LGK2_9ACAR|nr:unnamed protein product [Medioppia subpectinata]CAG2118281.1 unnamed protein product [Medioppia subpectinata]